MYKTFFFATVACYMLFLFAPLGPDAALTPTQDLEPPRRGSMMAQKSFKDTMEPRLRRDLAKRNTDMGVSINSGTPKSSISIGFSIIKHPFWGTPIFGNTHMGLDDIFKSKMANGCLLRSVVKVDGATHSPKGGL